MLPLPPRQSTARWRLGTRRDESVRLGIQRGPTETVVGINKWNMANSRFFVKLVNVPVHGLTTMLLGWRVEVQSDHHCTVKCMLSIPE